MGIMIAKASRESLDRLVRACMQSQKQYLGQLFDFCTDAGDYMPFNQVTGENITAEEDGPGELNDLGRTAEIGVPELLPGNYSLRIDLPNFTGLTAVNRDEIESFVEGLPEDKKDEVRRSYEPDRASASKALKSNIQQQVLETIIQPQLMEDRRTFRQYFTTLLVPTTEMDVPAHGISYEELVTLRPSAKKALQGIIDRYSSALIKELEEQVGNFQNGARLSLRYKIDEKGDISFSKIERKYLDEDIVSISSIPLPELPEDTEEREDYLREALTGFAYNKIISNNLKITQHPEYDTLFMRTEDGQLLGPTLEGEFVFEETVSNMVENLLDKIQQMPMVAQGGLVSVKTRMMDPELDEALVEYVILDPEQEMEVRSALPPVKTDDVLDKGDIYEEKARELALDVMVANMKRHPHFNRYFERLPAQDDLSDHIEPEYRFTEQGEIALERIYDKITDRITEAMLQMQDSREVPFYLKMGFDNPADHDGVQEPEILEMKKTVFNYGKAGFPQIIITSQKVPELKLTDTALRRDAAHIVDQVISHVIRPHMRSQAHPDYGRCFIEDTKNPGRAWITDEGVDVLEAQINDLTAKVSREILHLRSLTPEHMSGMRTVIDYGIATDDSIKAMQSQIQYFIPVNPLDTKANGKITFPLADVSAQLDKVIPEEREERLKKYLLRTSKNIILQLAAQNMYGTEHIKGQPAYAARPRHPAFDSFFVRDTEKKELVMTTVANEAIGDTIRAYSHKVFRQLSSIPEIERGGRFVLEYNIGPVHINYASVMKLGGGQGPEHKKILRQIIG